MILVIGSGPAAVSASTALIARGCEVTMLDAGLKIDPSRNTTASAKIDPKNPIKLAHGSDYPYAEVHNHINIASDANISCMPSFAQGGLSNVWGAFSEFYNEEELKDWPLTKLQFQQYYQEIDKILNPAISDQIATSTDKNVYNSSQQAKSLHDKWKKNSQFLQKNDLDFGTAKLAVNFSNYKKKLCKYCGLCQHGCPDDLIYCSRHTLKKLLQNKNFKYVENCVVDAIEENISGVSVHTHELRGNSTAIYKGKCGFIACGPVISTKLILEATKNFDQKISFLDSTHFLLPCIMKNRIKNASTEKLHTLAQLYIKAKNIKDSTHPINLQLYTYMDHYDATLKSALKILYPLFKPFLSPINERLIAIQGHLHSSDSNSFTMSVNKNHEVKLESSINEKTSKIIKNLVKKINKNHKELAFLGLSPALLISKISRSFHYGGSLPMKKNPQKFETNIFGQVNELNYWHVIDASIFPSIPAGSITPMIMANAYRIAKECQL